MHDLPLVAPDAPTPAPAIDPSPAPATTVSHEHAAPWGAVHFAPPEAWVLTEDYDSTVRGRDGDHLTYLLCARQVLSGTGWAFHSTSMRLETSLAVQDESQWSVQLDARSQSLTVHWLRVVRDGRVIDHLHRNRLRLIQRETQLERLSIDGTWTLVSVLEDVRPGDVLEAAYSYHNLKPIRPGATEIFFTVPPNYVVGRYCLTVLAEPEAIALKWKGSSDAAILIESMQEDGRRRLVWAGEQLVLREPEINQPPASLDCIWIQVSNLVDWRELTLCVADSWSRHGDISGFDAIPEFTRPEIVDEAAVVGLVRHIQDHFRYLSVNIELGGWTPTAPGVVARRRYGDCKDLAWLATGVLRSWGVTARPILVGADLREQVAVLLPMALLFNHAVLEVEVGGRSRWFDLTGRGQGGNFNTQAVTWFGHGLPVDEKSEGLRAQPGERSPSLYAIDETILLDTRPNQSSMLELRVRVEGIQADILRYERMSAGAEQFVKDRAQQAANRYVKATRVGVLHWRDDRIANVCELVEAFEVRDFLYIEERAQLASFAVPFNIVLHTLPVPPERERRTNWAMPMPLDIRHRISVRGPGMNAGPGRRRKWIENGFTGVIDEPKLAGMWSKIVHFSVTQPRIEPAQLNAYRKEIERFMIETTSRMIVPSGHPRARRNKGFGELIGAQIRPAPSALARPLEPAIVPRASTEVGGGARQVSPDAKLENREQIYPRSSGRRRRSSRSFQGLPNSNPEVPLWIIRGGCFVVLAILSFVLRGCAKGVF